jgi:hypothetical protein
MSRNHKHHVTPKSKGGTDSADNIVSLSPYDHALHHALDFLEGGPDFDFRHEAWPLLPEDLKLKVRGEKSRRQSLRLKENNPAKLPGYKEKLNASRRSYEGENNPFYGKEGCWKGKKRPEHAEKLRGRKRPEHAERMKEYHKKRREESQNDSKTK